MWQLQNSFKKKYFLNLYTVHQVESNTPLFPWPPEFPTQSTKPIVHMPPELPQKILPPSQSKILNKPLDIAKAKLQLGRSNKAKVHVFWKFIHKKQSCRFKLKTKLSL